MTESLSSTAEFEIPPAGRPAQVVPRRYDRSIVEGPLVNAVWRIAWPTMLTNIIVAGFAGVLVPLALERMGADPAVASSVFVTMMTDSMGFFAVLGLATATGIVP